jgi:hypothetical protein
VIRVAEAEVINAKCKILQINTYLLSYFSTQKHIASFKNFLLFFSETAVSISQMAVFKKKSFAIYTVNGFIVIAGAEFGKVMIKP